LEHGRGAMANAQKTRQNRPRGGDRAGSPGGHTHRVSIQ
jgi:hypothetical protein